MTDERLAVLCQSGNEAAWEELYKRYKPRVLSIARRFFLSGGETEDLVQNCRCSKEKQRRKIFRADQFFTD